MCRSSSPRAYALRKLPCEVTRNIDSFRDFKLEAVIKNGGTPSALAMKGYRFEVKCPDIPPEWAAWGFCSTEFKMKIEALGTNRVRYLPTHALIDHVRMRPTTVSNKRVQRYAVSRLKERGFLDFLPASYYEVDSD